MHILRQRDGVTAGAASPALHPDPFRLAAYVAGSKLRLRTKARASQGTLKGANKALGGAWISEIYFWDLREVGFLLYGYYIFKIYVIISAGCMVVLSFLTVQSSKSGNANWFVYCWVVYIGQRSNNARSCGSG